MRHIQTDGSNVVQTTLVYTINLAALLLLVGTLAYWGSVWLATDHTSDTQQETPRDRPVSDTGHLKLTAGNLFGIAQLEQHVPVASSIEVKLLGVIAASGSQKGYAVLKVDEKQILAITEGQAIVSGVVLAEVHSNHVLLERSGLHETLALPDPASSAGFAIPPESQIVAASTQINK
jgi:general secretion pathway protein C